MATSGDKSFKQTRDQLIYDAYQLLGVYGIGRSISAEDIQFASNTLNKMIKSWSGMGLHLWCKQEGILYLEQYQNRYLLGNGNGTAKISDAESSYITQLNGSVNSGSTSLTVDSTNNFIVGDNIGIVLSDKSLFWTTIATIPTSTTLTINNALTGNASDSNNIYVFTNKAYKPLRILSCRLVSGIDSGATGTRTEVIMNSIAYQTYFDMPTKSSNGIPNQFHYNPKDTDGIMYLWPRPSDCSSRIEFTYERIIEDLDTASNDFDFPSEWLEPVTYNLATRLGSAFGKDQKVITLLGPMAEGMLSALKSWDTEITSVSIMPDTGYN